MFLKLLGSIYLFIILSACGSTQHKQRDPALASTPVTRQISDSLAKYISHHESKLALINATLFNGTGSKPKHHQTLLIENGHFKRIGATEEIKIPKDFTIIDAEGKTILPGIVGVHNHLHMPGFHFIGEVASKLHLACGVTTIQTCGAAVPQKEIALAQQIEDGKALGPDIFTSGPYFTGPGGNPNMIIPRNEQHIRDTMQHYLNQGVTWFKVYRHTDPKDLAIILDEAHKNNAKVSGHFCSITFEEATKLGIDGIEHGLNSASDFRSNKEYGVCNGGREYMDELSINSPKVKQLHQLMIDNSVFLNSTLAIYESGIPNRSIADERTQKALSPYLLNQYHERRKRDAENQGSTKEKRLKKIMEFEYQFYQMGGLLGAGVDPGRHNLPGFGDQRNYELLIEAGFTTEEAIKIMTKNGAEILGQENIGSIEIGKRADFILLNGNLEKDKSVIRNVEVVFKEGVGYNSAALLEEVNGKVGLD